MTTRVLVVDDSALFRELISEVLNSAADMSVVATARDAEHALSRLQALSPDVMTLDIEMPGIDGISFLRQVMVTQPLPVVLVSTLTERSSAVAKRGIQAGAFGVVEKPKIDLRSGTMALAEELIDIVRKAARSRPVRRAPSLRPLRRGDETVTVLSSAATPGLVSTSAATPPAAAPLAGVLATASAADVPVVPHQAGPATRRSHHAPALATQAALPLRLRGQQPATAQVPAQPLRGVLARRRHEKRGPTRHGRIIAVGASTGGTEALFTVLSQLPADSAPVLVVQHMPPQFTGAFAARLNNACRMHAKEAVDGDPVQVGTILVAPGGYHMRLMRAGGSFVVRVTDDPPIGLHRPSVDALFESCARQAGGFAVGVLLTGMGVDGAYGLGEMRKAGAVTIAQDETTSVVFGMPKAAIERGAAAHVLPLDRIAGALTKPAR